MCTPLKPLLAFTGSLTLFSSISTGLVNLCTLTVKSVHAAYSSGSSLGSELSEHTPEEAQAAATAGTLNKPAGSKNEQLCQSVSG